MLRIKFCKPWMLQSPRPLFQTWLYEGKWGVMYRVCRIWRVSVIYRTRALVWNHTSSASRTNELQFKQWLRRME